MAMKHLTDEELFQLIDGEVSAEGKEAYQAHLVACEACQSLYKELNAISAYLSEAPLDMPSANFTNQLLDKWALSAAPLTYRKINNLNFLLLAIGLTLFTIVGSLWLAGQVSFPAIIGNSAVAPVDLTYMSSFFQQPWIETLLLVVNGILALLLLDKLVLQPFFSRKQPASVS
jgi:anti-sigma factor RsiW